MVLDREEGQHGVLYVANGGRPFHEDDFRAICEIGLSNKLPGEGIGYKGVGFRSVLQICRWPEIYSADPEAGSSDRFAGFCFGFAKPEDIDRLTRGNEAKCEAVRKDVSPYSLPVPLSEQNAIVKAFALI